jgi:hypothetical protein
MNGGALDAIISSNGRDEVETSSNGGGYHSHQFPNKSMRRLSFFVPRKKHLLQDESAPMVILTREKHPLPGRESFESDQDCACE